MNRKPARLVQKKDMLSEGEVLRVIHEGGKTKITVLTDKKKQKTLEFLPNKPVKIIN